jgi:hypothetical protein
MGEPLPIESAPRDERILVWYTEFGPGRWEIGYWSNKLGRFYVESMEDNVKDWPAVWQPLPEPPTPSPTSES